MTTASRAGAPAGAGNATTAGESDPTDGARTAAAAAVEGRVAPGGELLSTVPRQRGASPDETITDAPSRRRRVVAVAAVVAVVAVAGVALGQDAFGRPGRDGANGDRRVEAGRLGADAAARDGAADSARSAIAHARVTLASATHAGAGPVSALEASVDAADVLLADTGSTVDALTAATSLVSAGDRSLAAAEAAGAQAAAAKAAADKAAAAKAAAAKAAADKAAAAQAAAAKAAAAKAAAAKAAAAKSAATTSTATSRRATTSTTTRSTTTRSTTTTKRATTTKAASSTSTAASGTAALARVPSGGLTCTSRGSGAHVASVSSLGAAINAYRARLGLAKLRVVTSSTLVSHSLQMANTGGIWHSGHDNIVGCVSNASYTYLVQAWDRSAPHRAQMRRTGVTTMYVGDAERGSWLYGAVFFS
jgi:hypothetical protein